MRRILKYGVDLLTPISGKDYALVGVSLFVLKFCLDYSLNVFIFGYSFSVWNYLRRPHSPIPSSIQGLSVAYSCSLALVACIFIWIGVVLTVRRLRTVGRSPAWAVFFFAPLLNIALFAFLLIARDRPAQPHQAVALRHDPWSIAAVAVLIPSLIGLAQVAFSTYLLRDYGWGLFLGVPFVSGLLSGCLANRGRRLTFWQTQGYGACSITLIGILIFALVWEGIICIAMAAPIAYVLGGLGAAIGWSMSGSSRRSLETGTLSCLALPLLMVVETHVRPPPALQAVTTTLRIEAPPEVVWNNVVSFADLPEPTEWIFKTGLAYPQRAKIDGSGVGAVRLCEFSTGAFVEPITIWDPPKILAFDVTLNPAPMRELTFAPGVHPPHLDGYFISESGRFDLVDLGRGRTELRGTTYYRNHLWPRRYWTIFSDYIVSTIHSRVLRHIKQLSEKRGQVPKTEISRELGDSE